MLTATSALWSENYVAIPASVYNEWFLKDVDYLYASVNQDSLLITKEKRANAFEMELICPYNGAFLLDTKLLPFAFGFHLPSLLVTVLKIKVGSDLLLTLEDDKVTISQSHVIPLHSPERNTTKLLDKLRKEYFEAIDSKHGMEHGAILKDIYMFLLWGSWDDSTVTALLTKKTPLQDMLVKLRSDNEFNQFLDKKFLELLKDYICQCG